MASHDISQKSPSAPESGVYIRAACDNCRVRKIRCDRQSPCTQCASAKIECAVNEKRPREKRNRVLVSPNFETRIDQLDDRLADLSDLVRGLRVQQDGRCSNCARGVARAAPPDRASGLIQPSSTTSNSPAASSHTAYADLSTTVLGAEGESSLSAHSAFASDYLAHRVASDSPLPPPGPDMTDGMNTLSHVVTALKKKTVATELTFPHARPLQRPRPSGYELPPIQKAVELIGMAKTQRLSGTGLIYEFILFRQFSDMCLQVYFSDDYSLAEFVIVNSGLCSLFTDYASTRNSPPGQRDESMKHARMCRENLETALSDLPLHLPPTPDAIAALLFGSWHAVELSKPYLSWALSAKASEMGQTLGYHRIPDDDQSDEAKFKRFLFWTNYFLDKSLSLRLGRASTIPDWDITTHRPSADDDIKDPIMAFLVLWTEGSRCQGRIYELLYSPGAVCQPVYVRQARAEMLLEDLRVLEQSTQEIQKRWVQVAGARSGEDLVNFFAVSDRVLRLSMLTLVHRAMPQEASAPSAFSHSCTEAARATLRTHHDCLVIIEKNGDQDLLPTYVHWTLLFAPFIPFIVIFCRVIETLDKADLDLLGNFATSIQPTAPTSEAAVKLHRLFQTLHRVAAYYVGRFSSAGAQAQVPVQAQDLEMEHMDAFLVDLLGTSAAYRPGEGGQQRYGENMNLVSMAPTTGADTIGTEAAGGGAPWPMNPMLRMGHGSQLEEWFYSNQALMDTMDFSEGYPADDVA